MKYINKILFLIIMTGNIAAQNTDIHFDNISTFAGLSASRTKCIFQDSEGYLWIGTIGGGLNRYDGYSFTIFKNESDDSTSLIQNDVYAIAEDSIGQIWVATQDGISKFMKNENKFVNYNLRASFKELSELPYHSAYEIFVDSRERIWAGTSYHGALLFDKEKNEFIHIPQQSEDSIDALPQVYGDFTEDDDGRIWAAGGESGLFYYDEQKSIFRAAQMDADDFNLLKSEDVFRVFADSENNIWLMTTTDLYKYRTDSQELVHLLDYASSNAISGGHEGELAEDENGNMWMVHGNLPYPVLFPELSSRYISYNPINLSPTDIYIDSFGIIWVSDWSRGLFKSVPTKQLFFNLKNSNDGTNPWNNNDIFTINRSVTDSDLIYIYSAMYRWRYLRSFNIRTGQVIRYQSHNHNIACMLSNADGSFWVGLWNLGGLMKWIPETDTFTPYFSDETNNPNLADHSVAILKKDKKGDVWIGTTGGLYRMSSDEKKLELIIPDHAIPSLLFDDEILWIGTYGNGLIKYDLNTLEIENYKYDKYANSISNNIVWDLYRDKEGFLWIATEGGLNRLDLRTNDFEVYKESDGLGSDYIAALLPGNDGSIWMSTSSGISHLHKDSRNRVSFSNYDAMDGLMNPDFRHPVKYKDNMGRLYFGGRNGLYYFTPHSKRAKPARLHVTDVIINGKSPFQQNPGDFKKLQDGNLTMDLTHEQNTLSFEFIALHFAQPNKNRYAYFLEGYESDWVYSNKHEVQYVNLDPGTYSFHLRAANRDGIWSTERIIIPLKIAHPWWKTWYAYTAYCGLILIALVVIRRIELKRRKENENKKLLEAENKRKTEELEEARQLQLSMLPKHLPQLPHLDIAVYMQTATEVGGDYYDFHVSMDGTLTVVIGDATGHGMKAGTMVTTAKSLFNSYAPNPDILFSFREITRCIRQMNFSKLSMCMTMLKINGNTLRISSAGMPPSFIFRKDTRVVEEHLFQGMPLGTMEKFPYEIKDTTLNTGDTILLMSDGLPELENESGEMYGYKKIKNEFEDIAEQAPEEIINYLKNEAAVWTNNQDPEDDVTFVVIGVK